jgi:glycerol-3-phosphate O-acyltransferase/dihydroxyacetone phosphate acyltransferase
MESIPVSRAADSASPGTGLIRLSPDDTHVVLGSGTKFLSEFSPRMQIMLSKSMNSLVAEIAEVISDTELKIKKEFGGGKGTIKIHEKMAELRDLGKAGLEFKKLPFVDQQEMYQNVYDSLDRGGSIGIFPEGQSIGIL